MKRYLIGGALAGVVLIALLASRHADRARAATGGGEATDSTRVAVLTGSPMTVKSSRPPPPIVPTTTRPEFTRIPTSPQAS